MTGESGWPGRALRAQRDGSCLCITCRLHTQTAFIGRLLGPLHGAEHGAPELAQLPSSPRLCLDRRSVPRCRRLCSRPGQQGGLPSPWSSERQQERQLQRMRPAPCCFAAWNIHFRLPAQPVPSPQAPHRPALSARRADGTAWPGPWLRDRQPNSVLPRSGRAGSPLLKFSIWRH